MSEHWHQSVLTLLRSEQKQSRKDPVRLCVLVHVEKLIADRLRFHLVLAHLVNLQFLVFCQDVCDCVTKECFELCM